MNVLKDYLEVGSVESVIQVILLIVLAVLFAYLFVQWMKRMSCIDDGVGGSITGGVDNKSDRLRIAYGQWEYFNCFVNRLNNLTYDRKRVGSQNNRTQYELGNAIERLLLSIAQRNKHRDVIVISSVEASDPLIVKFKSELLEKKRLFTPGTINKIVNRAIYLINAFATETSEDKCGRCNHKVDVGEVSFKDGVISFRDCKQRVNSWNFKQLQKFPLEDVAIMLLKYSTLRLGSQQWEIPYDEYEVMYNKYGIRYEGFASPLNSRLIGRPNAKFCSLFDSDKVFGGLGDFFSVDMLNPEGIEGFDNARWAVNPPYIESMLVGSARKCMESLLSAEQSNKTLFIHYMMPAWLDMPVYSELKNFKHTKHSEVLQPRAYYYEYGDKKILATFGTAVFLMWVGNMDVDVDSYFNTMKVE